jgi:hypothetical protein
LPPLQFAGRLRARTLRHVSPGEHHLSLRNMLARWLLLINMLLSTKQELPPRTQLQADNRMTTGSKGKPCHFTTVRGLVHCPLCITATIISNKQFEPSSSTRASQHFQETKSGKAEIPYGHIVSTITLPITTTKKRFVTMASQSNNGQTSGSPSTGTPGMPGMPAWRGNKDQTPVP